MAYSKGNGGAVRSSSPAISKHLSNVFETNELEEKSVISILETTASDGKNYKTSFYNLDAVSAVWCKWYNNLIELYTNE